MPWRVRSPLQPVRLAAGLAAPALLSAALLGAACSGEPSAEEERQQLTDDLIAETGGALGQEEAECVAQQLQDDFGEEAYRAVLDAAAERGAPDADDGVRSQVIDIFGDCDALAQITEPAD